MKLMNGRTRLSDSPPGCAAAVLDNAIHVVRLVRAEIRRHRPAGLTVTQLRALGFLRVFPGASLADLATHLGLGAPTASKLIASLARRRLVQERVAAGDRRRRSLRLTARGASRLDVGFRLCRRQLATRIATLSPAERRVVMRAAALLRPVVAPPAPADRLRRRASADRSAAR